MTHVAHCSAVRYMVKFPSNLLSGPPNRHSCPSPGTSTKARSVPGCQDEGMRIDPDPAGPELGMLSQYLDYQRETVLSKTDGLTRQQLAQQHSPSQLTLAGLVNHLS